MAYFQSNWTTAGPLQVAFLGPPASFSHQAALESFGPTTTFLPQSSFGDTFAAIQSGDADYAIIPFENSSNGAVVQTLDLLADRDGLYPDVAVCAEYYLPVHHCLLVKSGLEEADSENQRYDQITKLYTHPQAWGQCEKFLARHFKGVERQDVSSTSKAAEIVSGEGGKHGAAIASKFAGTHHGLVALAENIEDDASNTTRFLILRTLKSERTRQAFKGNSTTATVTHASSAKRKTLISFIIDHDSPGALADALVIFKRHGLNLTSINTRPGGIHPWQYVFFVECQRIPQVHDGDLVERVMRDLQSATKTSRDLGSWEDQLPTS